MEGHLNSEFLQGFYEETSEHLQSINQNLLKLEQSISGEQPIVDSLLARVGLVNELFRSFHTIKGLAGMVGLEPAARLSHATETLLQAVQNARLEVDLALIDALLESTRTLEEIVRTAVDPNAAMPAIDAELASLAALLAQESTPVQAANTSPSAPGHPLALFPGLASYPEIVDNLSEEDALRIRSALDKHLFFTLIIFLPSEERALGGENVDWARQQVQSAGEILKAVPLLSASGIRFAFLIASPQPLAPDSLPGLEVTPLEAAPVAPVPLPSVSHTQAEGPLPTSVRVDLSRLDEVMQGVSSLILQQARLHESHIHLTGLPLAQRRELRALEQQSERTLRDLRHAILRIRMVPLHEVFNQMPLVVRDITRSTGKEVQLEIEGGDTEVDKFLVDRLLDPLIHLVRNAIVHGVEPPEERLAAGKPRKGFLKVSGEPEGNHIVITVSDDGRGLDIARLSEEAVQHGWLKPGETIQPQDLTEMITRPGLSTLKEAGMEAGRGMGLDVVQRTVQSFRGSLSIETDPGQGTNFHIRLPLTLVVVEAFIVRIGGERYAIPQDAVDRMIEVAPGSITRLESGELIPYQDRSLSLLRLSDWVHLPDGSSSKPTVGFQYGLIASANPDIALVVDRVIGLREVVLQTLADPLLAQPGIAGGTELGDGAVVLLLDLPTLIRTAQARRT